jgi:hypothetical protein
VPDWHVTVPRTAQPWSPPEPAVSWPHDGWVFGVVTALVAVLLRADGPAATAALGLGGTAAAFVAARVGYLTQHADVLRALRALGYDPQAVALEVVDFRLRALGVVVAWPIAAMLVHTCAVALRSRRR